jgi:hypothetical protein
MTSQLIMADRMLRVYWPFGKFSDNIQFKKCICILHFSKFNLINTNHNLFFSIACVHFSYLWFSLFSLTGWLIVITVWA